MRDRGAEHREARQPVAGTHPIPTLLEWQKAGLLPAATVDFLLETHLDGRRSLAIPEHGYYTHLLLDDDPSSRGALEKAQKNLRLLLRVSSAERASAIDRAATRFWSPVETALLLDEAQTWLQDSPKETLNLARLAGRIAYRAGSVPLQALASAIAGNALRVAGDLTAAGAEFGEMRRHLHFALHCHWLIIECRLLEASWLKDQREIDLARALLDRILFDLRGSSRHVAIARAYMKLADLERLRGDGEAAVEAVVAALSFLDPRADGRLHVLALAIMAGSLLDAGRVEESAQLLNLLRPHYFDVMVDRLPRLRWNWLEGQVLLAQGNAQAAEALFKEALARYTEADSCLLAAFVALDLTVLLLEQGRTVELRALVRPLVTLFRSQRLDEEARKVLAVLTGAIARDGVNLELARTAQARLKQVSGAVVGI